MGHLKRFSTCFPQVSGVLFPLTLQSPQTLTVDFKKGGEGKGVFGEMRGGGETRFTIRRSDFGMNFQQGAIGDEVTIILSLEGIKQ